MPITAAEPPAGTGRSIHVMAGIIGDDAGRILVTRRAEHVEQGGLWEFPGGKLEPGETPRQGLARELAEELGIEVLDSRPLIRVRHAYPAREVLLDVHRIGDYRGTPHGREGQPLDWRCPTTLDPTDFPAADRPVITALCLPELLLITGMAGNSEEYLKRIEQALQSGVRLVQLRAHHLDTAAYRALATRAHALCEHHTAKLVLNRTPAEVSAVPRHGLHLTSTALLAARGRPGIPGELLSASCHDAVELRQAAALGLDYAVLGPVQATASHPETTPLGWPRLAALLDTATLPVYALGGLGRADLSNAWEHGAQGVAAIRELWLE